MGLFYTAICLPMLSNLVHWPPSTNTEKRTKPQLPVVDFGKENLGTLIKEYDQYFSDNFGLRDWFIKTHSFLELRIFRGSSTGKVLAGKNGWLFYTDVSDGDPLGCYRGTQLFTPDDLTKIAHNLESMRKWLEKKHKMFYVFIAPEKVSIYFEYLPDYLRKISTKNRFDQLVDFLRLNTHVAVIDPRLSLMSHKNQCLLYCKLDSHWNAIGAFWAYRALVDCVRKDFPAIRPLELDDFDVDWSGTGQKDLAAMLMLTDVLHENLPTLLPRNEAKFQKIQTSKTIEAFREKLVKTDNPDRTLPSAVIYRDSFLTGILNFIPQNFRRTYNVWDAYPDFELIAREDPDMVLLELTERAIANWQYIIPPQNTP